MENEHLYAKCNIYTNIAIKTHVAQEPFQLRPRLSSLL